MGKEKRRETEIKKSSISGTANKAEGHFFTEVSREIANLVDSTLLMVQEKSFYFTMVRSQGAPQNHT